jgi:acylglycerol lipase
VLTTEYYSRQQSIMDVLSDLGLKAMKIAAAVRSLTCILSFCLAVQSGLALGHKKSADETPDPATVADAHAAPCINWVNPLVPARAILLCIHGLGLNSNAYANFGKHMSRLGIATYAIDVRGFGSWMQAQGHAQLDFDGTLSDIQQTLKTIRAANPGLPVFLLGESMGGAIALRACSMYPDLIDGLISSVPAGDRFQQKRTDVSVALHFIKGPRKQFDIGDKIVNQATQNSQLKDAWESDPLNRMDLSADELIQFQKFMNENHNAVKVIDHTPVLMVQGTMDKLVKPEGTWELFEELPSIEKTFVAMPSEHLVFEEGQAKSAKYDQKAARLVATWIFSCLNTDPQTPNHNLPAGSQSTSDESSGSEAPPNPPDSAPFPRRGVAGVSNVGTAPKSPNNQMTLIALCNQGKYQQALPGLEALTQKKPLDGEAHFWLGTCYKQLKRPRLAWREFVLARSLAQASQRTNDANNSLLDLATSANLTSKTVTTTTPLSARVTAGKPTILIFWASWCAECEDLNKITAQARRAFGNGIQIKKIDVDDRENEDLVKNLNIGPIPTCVFVKPNGSVQSTLIGLSSYANFAKSVQGILQ